MLSQYLNWSIDKTSILINYWPEDIRPEPWPGRVVNGRSHFKVSGRDSVPNLRLYHQTNYP